MQPVIFYFQLINYPNKCILFFASNNLKIYIIRRKDSNEKAFDISGWFLKNISSNKMSRGNILFFYKCNYYFCKKLDKCLPVCIRCHNFRVTIFFASLRRFNYVKALWDLLIFQLRLFFFIFIYLANFEINLVSLIIS